MASFFVELSIVMVVILIVSLIMMKIKQPLLIGYILTGLIAGPLFFNFISPGANYEAFAHIGIALLLFIVGLSLNVSLIRDVGPISLITGLGQVVFTSSVGYFIALLLGFSPMASLMIAIGLTFSSTIIIIKLLSDKKDLDSLYGKISLGFLLVQDFVAVILLMFVSSMISVGPGGALGPIIIKTILLGIVSVVLTYVLAKYFVPKFVERIAHSQELLFIFVIAWCLGFSTLFYVLGFSLEIGALLAGITLASTRYQYEISSKIRPLRDFFIIMFFILLGAQMIPDVPVDVMEGTLSDKIDFITASISGLIVPALIFSLFVLIGNPIIVFILMSLLKYSSRTSFLAGLTVAQISEFSLILGLMAKEAGLLTTDEISMLTFVGIITITASTYMIMNGDYLYKLLSPFLKKFESKRLKDAKKGVRNKHYDIIIFGSNRIGYSILKSIRKSKKEYLVVDNDPMIVDQLKSKGINCIYGDASSTEFLSEFNFKDTKLVISTIPNREISLLILEHIRQINKDSQVILTSNHVDDALYLYDKGTDYVILPHFLGGEYVADLVNKLFDDISLLLQEKIEHINDLKTRKDIGHKHPGN